MRKTVKRAGATAALGGSLLFAGGVAIANAAPGTNVDDQLVNLGVGNNGNFLQGVNVDVASQIAGLLCGIGTTGPTANGTAANTPNATGMSNTNIRDITALANQVDAGQIPTTTCESAQGVVTISQNGSTTAPNASNVPGNAPTGNNVPAGEPNAENGANQPNGSQSGGPSTAPMAPTSGQTPTS